MCDNNSINLLRNISQIAYITYNVQQAYEALSKLQQTEPEQHEPQQPEPEQHEPQQPDEQHEQNEQREQQTQREQHKQQEQNELGRELCLIVQQEQDCDFAKASRMSLESYKVLKTLLYEKMTACKHVIDWQTRLDMTILYLAHGLNRKTLAHAFKLSMFHVPTVVAATADIICEELQDICLNPATAEDWLTLAAQMSALTDLKHCLGAVETTPITMNTKEDQTLYLLLSCNHDLCFTLLNINHKRKNAKRKPMLPSNLPEAQMLADLNCELPYYFVSNDRLSLSDCILQTYNEPAAGDQRKLFNLHANKLIDDMHIASSILQQRWKFFANWKINIDCRHAIKHISACIMLHNFLILQQDAEYFNDTTTNRNEILLMHKPVPAEADFIATEASTELRSQVVKVLFP